MVTGVASLELVDSACRTPTSSLSGEGWTIDSDG